MSLFLNQLPLWKVVQAKYFDEVPNNHVSFLNESNYRGP